MARGDGPRLSPGSSSNVRRHSKAIAAFNRHEVETFLSHCDPRIELVSAVTVPGGAVYRGLEGVRAWFRDLEDVFGVHIRIVPEGYVDLGDSTLSLHSFEGRGQLSGAGVAAPAAHVCRWRDGLVVYFKGYLRREEAFAELGISEDSVERIEP